MNPKTARSRRIESTPSSLDANRLPVLSLEPKKRMSSFIIGRARFDPKGTRDPRRCTPRESLACASGQKRGRLPQLLGNLLSLLIALDHSGVVRGNEGVKLHE